MNRKLYTLVSLLLTATLLLLAACGGGAAPEAPAEEAAPAEAAGGEEAAAPADEAMSDTHESPMLHEQVMAGNLPPLDERIPAEPLVIEPYGEVGQYGGTWHRFDTSTDGSHLAMAMYGYSPVHWRLDGLDKVPGLAKG